MFLPVRIQEDITVFGAITLCHVTCYFVGIACYITLHVTHCLCLNVDKLRVSLSRLEWKKMYIALKNRVQLSDMLHQTQLPLYPFPCFQVCLVCWYQAR